MCRPDWEFLFITRFYGAVLHSEGGINIDTDIYHHRAANSLPGLGQQRRRVIISIIMLGNSIIYTQTDF